MSWVLLLVLACGGPDETPAGSAAPPAVDGEAPADAASGSVAPADGAGPPPADAEADEGSERTPSDLSGIDAAAPEDPAARAVGLALVAALDAEDPRAAVDQMSTTLKEEEGPGMFESFGDHGTTVIAGETRYLGQRDGQHHYLGSITVTEPGQGDAAPLATLLLFHVQVGKADGDQWKVVGINAWPPDAEAPAGG